MYKSADRTSSLHFNADLLNLKSVHVILSIILEQDRIMRQYVNDVVRYLQHFVIAETKDVSVLTKKSELLIDSYKTTIVSFNLMPTIQSLSL